jgi:RNA polymerase sigma-B factor
MSSTAATVDARQAARDPITVGRLFARMHAGDERARETLIELHLPFAFGLARRYARRGEPLDDLQLVASLALVKAVDGFDTERGVGFRSYASPTILGELKRHFRDRTWALRVPRSLNERALEVERANRELTDRLGTAPGSVELAEHLDWSLEQVLEALEAGSAHSTLSLDAPRPGDGERETLGESLGNDDGRFELIDAGATIAGVLKHLTPRDRRVLELRFAADLTQSQIADEIGCSQMQVSRILRASLEKLRTLTGADEAGEAAAA